MNRLNFKDLILGQKQFLQKRFRFLLFYSKLEKESFLSLKKQLFAFKKLIIS